MKPLTEQEAAVILRKGTEAPFAGKYNNTMDEGLYICRQCGAPLYNSTDKFKSECGWPSFDDQIHGAVSQVIDPDGWRTEIVCAKCKAHLGHIFQGEKLTAKNIRHCVNSVSMEFVPAADIAIFAGGCFWGVEHLMQGVGGVRSVESGYIGGKTPNPTYEQVCSKITGYAEAVRVIFDPTKTDYETLAKLFFEIHDPTQVDGQGPDIGNQYRSEVFYYTTNQRLITEKLIDQLRAKGYNIATRITRATTFYPAEEYHQDYYNRKGTEPYCHKYTKKF